jgi:hypothetical protein
MPTPSFLLDQIVQIETEIESAQDLLTSTREHAINNGILSPEIETTLARQELQLDQDRAKLRSAKVTIMYL